MHSQMNSKQFNQVEKPEIKYGQNHERELFIGKQLISHHQIFTLEMEPTIHGWKNQTIETKHHSSKVNSQINRNHTVKHVTSCEAEVAQEVRANGTRINSKEHHQVSTRTDHDTSVGDKLAGV